MSGGPQFNLAIRQKLGKFSGSVAAGGASQKLLDASDNWSYIFIQNPSSAIESLFINFTDDATLDNNSMELLPGADLTMKIPGWITNEQINVTAATMGHTFVCKAT